MNARISLTVINHNMSQNRGKKSRTRTSVQTAFSKITGQWVAKPVYNNKTYQWVNTMMKGGDDLS